MFTPYVHIRWKRYNPVKQKSVIVSQKYGGGYGFLLANEYVGIAYIKSAAIELFFPNQQKSYFDVDINECEVQLTDSTGNFLGDRLISKNLKENGLYLSKMYFILYTKCKNN